MTGGSPLPPLVVHNRAVFALNVRGAQVHLLGMDGTRVADELPAHDHRARTQTLRDAVELLVTSLPRLFQR